MPLRAGRYSLYSRAEYPRGKGRRRTFLSTPTLAQAARMPARKRSISSRSRRIAC